MASLSWGNIYIKNKLVVKLPIYHSDIAYGSSHQLIKIIKDLVTGVLWGESGAKRGGKLITKRRYKDYDEEVKGLWWGETGLDKVKVGMLQLQKKNQKNPNPEIYQHGKWVILSPTCF